MCKALDELARVAIIEVEVFAPKYRLSACDKATQPNINTNIWNRVFCIYPHFSPESMCDTIALAGLLTYSPLVAFPFT